MSYIMFLIVLLMVGKDTFQLGDPYYMRGIAQIVGLLVAIGLLVFKPPRQLVLRYWPLGGYVGSMILTSIQSSIPSFVLLQIGSLGSMLLFAVAYFDGGDRSKRERALIRSVIAVYLCTAIASLVIAKYASSIAYEMLYAGDAYGDESRFRGLFSKSAMMGAAGGILVGAAWFGVKARLLKALFIVPGLICMGLTLSRTFWLASIVAGATTAWFYYPSRGKMLAQGFGMLLLVTVLGVSVNLTINDKALSTAFRFHTITNLTGRVDLWVRGMRALEDRPWLGYGFTFGSEGLQANKVGIGMSAQHDARKIAKVSLHNGYMQSILDSGLIGTFFYLATITLSLWRLVKKDKNHKYPAAFYCILFLVFANLGESIIYSASVFHSVLFWFLAVFALGLHEGVTRQTRRYGGALLNAPGKRQLVA